MGSCKSLLMAINGCLNEHGQILKLFNLMTLQLFIIMFRTPPCCQMTLRILILIQKGVYGLRITKETCLLDIFCRIKLIVGSLILNIRGSDSYTSRMILLYG